MSEVKTITYFCPEPCEGLATEQPRDTGKEYFGPPGDEDEEQLTTASQTSRQQDVAKINTKPEPGTVYFLPETCATGSDTFLDSLLATFSLKPIAQAKSFYRLVILRMLKC